MTVVIEYAAPQACPSEAEFRQALESRMQQGAGQWKMILRIERRFSGTLTVMRGAEIVLARVLEDDSCADLVTALAIAGALAIESAPAPPPKPEPLPEAIFDAPPPPPVEHLAFRAGLSTEVTSFLSPSPSLGLVGFAELERPGRFFALRVRVGAHFATSFPVQVESASALVSSGFVRLELGGLHLRLAKVLALRAAAIGDLGFLVVEGRDIPGAQTVTAPFADVGAMARLAWETSIFFLEIAGGGVVPLTRPTFYFALPAKMTAFEVPPAGALGEVGVGVRFF